jgi:hypothetical protein
MDPYIIDQLMTARHDDLVRDADESRAARLVTDTHEEAPPKPAAREGRARRYRIA